ncbi:unnamed protein product [Mycetohabitans rhizoxinica HKI 454]|uniref:Uncharacterized protein n=1 Tax=Mycetohabitans rhizoxinica (strain DSM 19002 / CIP 109453 / HKI 454) TaxID=882378 RepID=E5ARW6_MYCRK|nr:unnamed protein product [Mycetohabitans rhizoxinica HKI 454]
MKQSQGALTRLVDTLRKIASLVSNGSAEELQKIWNLER